MPGAGATWMRIGAATVAAVAVAEVAVWALRPRDAIPPARVSEHAYFTPEQIQRAESFRAGQRWLHFGTLALEAGALAALAGGRPRSVRRALEKPAKHPVRAAAAAGAGLSVCLAALTLPLGAVAHQRSVDAGLSTQSVASWLADVGRSTAIGAVFAAGGAVLLILLVRRFGRRWWVPASAVAVVLAGLFTWLAPIVLAPIFNKFERLPSGRARRDVLQLAGRAHVDVGQVYRVDASRRSRALNAYVDGFGPSRRVVLYDTLLEGTNRRALRSVVAHELGHVADRDILRGLAFFTVVAVPGLLLAGLLADRLMAGSGVRPGSVAALPAYALALGAVAFLLGVPGNQLSRAVEERADAFALRLTDDPGALVDVQRRLAISNLAEPDPPRLMHLFFGAHPTTMERIGAAVAYERAHTMP